MTNRPKNSELTAQLKALPLDLLARSIQKLAQASSPAVGRDCVLHAYLCQGIIRRLGVQTQLVIGDAAWRVGPGDGDVIVHSQQHGTQLDSVGAGYHAWLQAGNWLLDFTTYQFASKGQRMTAMDGIPMRVDWNPSYLFRPLKQISPFATVVQKNAGLFYYQQNQAMQDHILAGFVPDDSDIEMLWLIYNNPDVNIFGPNNIESM